MKLNMLKLKLVLLLLFLGQGYSFANTIDPIQDASNRRKWSVELTNVAIDGWGGAVGYNIDSNFMLLAGLSDGKLDSGTDDYLVADLQLRFNLSVPRNLQKPFFQPFLMSGYYYLSENHPFAYLGPSIRYAETEQDLSLEVGGEFLTGFDFIGTELGVGYSLGPYRVLASSEIDLNSPVVTGINQWGFLTNFFVRCNF